MLQILGIRSLRDNAEKKYDAFHEKHWGAGSLQELFENLDTILKGIPKSEHFNLFFTPADCTDKKREFQSLSALFFDIDHIDREKVNEYVSVVCKALGVNATETGVVFSGNGLHFYIGLQVSIVSKDFFKQNRDHYKALVSRINAALKTAGLPGDADPSVFDPRRLMRLPGTLNKKANKPEVMARLLNSRVIPINFDITSLSGIPMVKKTEQVDEAHFKKFPRVDNAAIFQGCAFLRHCRDDGDSINEPQWYAALSITARMDEGHKVSHELSKNHRGYSPDETDLKIEQAQNASGPRTCESINNIWHGCKACPNFKKITSPILLRGPDSIKTEHTGFHDMVYDEETGRVKRGKPNYEDLRKFFEREHTYVTHAKNCSIWNGKHYVDFLDSELAAFAHKHFDPTCTNTMAAEFMGAIYRTNLVASEFWSETPKRKVNFQNGVLDIDMMELQPHSKTIGFRYVLPYDYAPGAKCPTFEKFLDDVTCGNKDLQTLLIEFAGYALSGDEPWAAKMLVLEGDGRNGKGTFLKTLKAAAGKNAYMALSLKLLKMEDRRAGLDGALFNICEEAPRGMGDSADIKALSAGDEISARRLYKEVYFFENRAKLIFSCNALPKTDDTSHGYFERFCIVPFNATFDKTNRDPFIQKKILAELPGIFNLFIAGYKELRKREMFIETDASRVQLENYKVVNDSIRSWLGECVTLLEPSDETQFVTLSKLFDSYASYTRWAVVKREEQYDFETFKKRIQKVIPYYRERMWRTNAERRLRGVSAIEMPDRPY